MIAFSNWGKQRYGRVQEGFNRDDVEFEMKRAGPYLKLGALSAVLLIVLVLLGVFLLRVTRIEAEHVGAVINLAGQQRGAS